VISEFTAVDFAFPGLLDATVLFIDWPLGAIVLACATNPGNSRPRVVACAAALAPRTADG
jgi:hypothetical protein